MPRVTVRPRNDRIWPQNPCWGSSYVAEVQQTPNSRGERSLCVQGAVERHLSEVRTTWWPDSSHGAKEVQNTQVALDRALHAKWSFSATIWSLVDLRNIILSRAQQNVRRQMFRFSSEKIQNRAAAWIRGPHDPAHFFSRGFIHILQGFGVDIPITFREKIEQLSFSR